MANTLTRSYARPLGPVVVIRRKSAEKLRKHGRTAEMMLFGSGPHVGHTASATVIVGSGASGTTMA